MAAKIRKIRHLQQHTAKILNFAAHKNYPVHENYTALLRECRLTLVKGGNCLLRKKTDSLFKGGSGRTFTQ